MLLFKMGGVTIVNIGLQTSHLQFHIGEAMVHEEEERMLEKEMTVTIMRIPCRGRTSLKAYPEPARHHVFRRGFKNTRPTALNTV